MVFIVTNKTISTVRYPRVSLGNPAAGGGVNEKKQPDRGRRLRLDGNPLLPLIWRFFFRAGGSIGLPLIFFVLFASRQKGQQKIKIVCDQIQRRKISS